METGSQQDKAASLTFNDKYQQKSSLFKFTEEMNVEGKRLGETPGAAPSSSPAAFTDHQNTRYTTQEVENNNMHLTFPQ